MRADIPCIFCEIVAGRAEASIVFEDDLIIAFMTLNPTRPGEFQIIPKEHIDEFCDLPEELACHIIRHAQRLSKNMRREFKPKRVGFVLHGFGVPHAHLIIVPQHETTDIISGRHIIHEDGELKFDCSRLPTPERSELDKQACSISHGGG